MQRTSFADMICPIARSLEVIGEWWTLLILRDVAVGITRFDDLQRELGISRRVLTERLAKLVDAGVLRRTAYQHKPTRYDYTLTEKGADLTGVFVALQTWGERWTFEGESRPIALRHAACGETMQAVATCSSCGERLDPRDVTPVAGPGLEEWPERTEVDAARERFRIAAGRRSARDVG